MNEFSEFKISSRLIILMQLAAEELSKNKICLKPGGQLI